MSEEKQWAKSLRKNRRQQHRARTPSLDGPQQPLRVPEPREANEAQAPPTEAKTARTLNTSRREKLGHIAAAKQLAERFDVDTDNLKDLTKEKNLEKVGEQLGQKINADLEKGKFVGFIAALIIALIKDSVDVFSLGWVGTIIHPIASIALFVIIRLQTGIIERMIKKFIIKHFLAAMVMEAIPFLNFLPIWALMILDIKRKITKRRGKRKKELNSFMKKIKQRKGRGRSRTRLAARSRSLSRSRP